MIIIWLIYIYLYIFFHLTFRSKQLCLLCTNAAFHLFSHSTQSSLCGRHVLQQQDLKKKTSQRWNDKRLKSGAAKVTARLSGKFWKSPTDPSMQADWTLSTPGIWASSPGVERLNDTDKVQILLFSKWESMCLMRASSGYPVGKVSWHRGQLRTALSSDSIHNCREKKKIKLKNVIVKLLNWLTYSYNCYLFLASPNLMLLWSDC